VGHVRACDRMLAARFSRPAGRQCILRAVRPLYNQLDAPLRVGFRGLSEVASPDIATRVATESMRASDSDAHPSSELNTSSKAIRTRMMAALRQREYKSVLSEYDSMIEAGVAPDTLAMNCIVEAKAYSQGPAQARETLQVCADARSWDATYCVFA
jgi:hypothetical protein